MVGWVEARNPTAATDLCGVTDRGGSASILHEAEPRQLRSLAEPEERGKTRSLKH